MIKPEKVTVFLFFSLAALADFPHTLTEEYTTIMWPEKKEEFLIKTPEISGDSYYFHSSFLQEIPGTFDDLFTSILILPSARASEEVWALPKFHGISLKKIELAYDGFPIFTGFRPGRFSYFSVSEPFYFQASGESADTHSAFPDSIRIIPDTLFKNSVNINLQRFTGSYAGEKEDTRYYFSADGTTANLYLNRLKDEIKVPGTYNIKVKWEKNWKYLTIKNILFGTRSVYEGNVPEVSNIPLRGKANWDVHYATMGSSLSARVGEKSSLNLSLSYNTHTIKGSQGENEKNFNIDMNANVVWSDLHYIFQSEQFEIKAGVNTVYITKFSGESQIPIDARSSEKSYEGEKGMVKLKGEKRGAITTGYLNFRFNDQKNTRLFAGIKAVSALPERKGGVSPELYLSFKPLKFLELYSRNQFLNIFYPDAYDIMVDEKMNMEKVINLTGGINLKFPSGTVKLEGFLRNYSKVEYFSADIDFSDPCNPIISVNAERDGQISSKGVELISLISYPSSHLLLSYSYHSSTHTKNGIRYPSEFQHSFRLININRIKSWKISSSFYFLSPIYYTPLKSVGALPDICTNSIIYYPIWENPNSGNLGNYYRVDLSISKNFKIGETLISAYLDVFNLFGIKNILGYSYSEDYSLSKVKKSLPPIPVVGIRVYF